MIIDIINEIYRNVVWYTYGPGAPNDAIHWNFAHNARGINHRYWQQKTVAVKTQPTNSDQTLIYHTFITIEQAQWQSLEITWKYS